VILRAAIAAVVVLGVLVAGGGARPAWAQRQADDGARAQAKKLAESAQVHFDLGEYDAAVADFKEAYRLFPTPGLLYNLGQAYRLKGDCANAATMYRNYLRLDTSTPHRAVVEKHLAEMEECAKHQPPPAEPAPEAAPPPVVAPKPAPASPAPGTTRRAPDRRGGRGLRLAGLAAVGVGAAATAAGVYFGLEAADAADKVTAFYEHGNGRWEQIAAEDERGRQAEILSGAFLATGGAAIAAGAVLYYLGWRSGSEHPVVTVVPGAGSAQVAARWSF